ncbi:MAG TPA: acetyltransferase [Thermoanaerobaculia bacterium]|nr:acetyltransferase [Thermoanaerobaculia bacterium]
MLRALVFLIFLPLNLAFWGTLVFLTGLAKLVTFGSLRRKVILVAAFFGERWVATNNWMFDRLLDTRWDIRGMEGVRRDAHTLIISNHISWVDIVAEFRAFHGRAPIIRFFLKHTLMWAPVVGQAAWALEFPFMRRYSAEYLKQHPEKRGRDLETTRRACARYRDMPVPILNYVEGTRFDREKHEEQQSPYRYLLRPRIGGIAFVIASLADQLDAIYDVTLVYPRRDVTMWDLVSNKIPWIIVHGRRLDVPAEFRTDAIIEPGPTRDAFKEWVGRIWQEKDDLIGRVLAESE